VLLSIQVQHTIQENKTMASSVTLKKKTVKSVFTDKDIQQMIEFYEFVKAYSKAAIQIHNSCLNGAPVSQYQENLKKTKNHAHNQLKLSIKALGLENTPENQAAVSKWKVAFDTASLQIQNDITKAKQQYLLIRQANWIFVTIYDLVKTKSPLVADAQLAHSIGEKGDPILLITIGDQQLSCPKGFTSLDLDSNGFNQINDHVPVEAGIYYEGIKDIMDFRPEILAFIQDCRTRYITYDVK
jgi:hypothetical protein